MQILLFDIDGTLIRSGGAGKAAMEDALRDEFGTREILDRVSYSGRTDPAIARELLEVHGLEPSDANVKRLKAAYLRLLPNALQQHGGIVLPGIRDLLRRLRTQDRVVLGLLTGNLRAGAECKLGHFDLWNYFAFGGFADGIPDRDDVARHAKREVERFLGRDVDSRDVWVIGDTPLDVKCARAIGAKAVAVATGWHTLDELKAAKADWLLRDFEDSIELQREWGVGN